MLTCACIIHAALVLQQWTSGAVSEAIVFPGGSEVNNLPAKQEENPMDRGAWWVTVRRVARSWTQLSN